ncbi:MAG: glutaminyl-peptide cyclotransferase [Chitinophagaceae bacterium]|nr:glutaminyl-peptide cyclotransferase [Chitinophagaceae bacterium]
MKQLKAAALFILVLNSCTNDTPDENNNPPQSAIPAPQQLNYTILNVYPHDTTSYTQGLQYLNGVLYEGTGNPGEKDNISKLRKIDYKTGKVLKETFIKGKLFGEGITILGDKIYQLTWKDKKVFVYNLSDFKLIKEFSCNIEGWGLTNDGKNLIVSDGSDLIYFWDPVTLTEVRRISVQDHTGLRNNINEMEYINGFIYANVYMTDEVLKIKPDSGHVVGRIDFSGLKASYPELGNPPSDYFNGIAWDSAGNRFFVTGKNWSKLFEVRVN